MLFRLPEDSITGGISMPIGTAFGVLRPGLVLTADHVVREMDARSLLAAKPHPLDRRRESVEHRFGTIKHWMGQGTFLTRRLGNVRGEFSLTALAYNMRRAINLLGVPALVAAASS